MQGQVVDIDSYMQDPDILQILIGTIDIVAIKPINFIMVDALSGAPQLAKLLYTSDKQTSWQIQIVSYYGL